MQSQETIIPLIKIQEKLENCDEAQQKLFCKQFKNKLMKQTIWNKIDIIKRLLCCIHSNLTQDFFEELLDLFPQTQQNENDDSENQDENENSEEIICINSLPNDLLIYTFQFLTICDLYNLEKTSRSLCIIARNPSTLYHLKLEYKPNFEQYYNYQHTRYSKIQSLSIERYNEDADKNGNDRFVYWTSLLPIFINLFYIMINNSNIHSLGSMPSTICYQENITEVHIYFISIDSLLTLISNCKNIEILDIGIIVNDGDVYEHNIINKTHHPLPYLKHLTIDLRSIQHLSCQYFVYWMLADGQTEKTFTLMDNIDVASLLSDDEESYGLRAFFNPNSSSDIVEMQKKALLNISNLNLGVLDVYSINNFAKWIKSNKDIKFDTLTIDLINIYTKRFMNESHQYSFPDDLVNPLDVMLSISNKSKMYWSDQYQIIPPHGHYLYSFPIKYDDEGIVSMMREWPLQILNGKLSNYKFCEIKIMPSLKVKRLIAIDIFGDSPDIFSDNIEYWLKLKASNMVQLEYDILFKNFAENNVLWNNQIDRLQEECNRYPVKVDIIRFDNGFRVRF